MQPHRFPLLLESYPRLETEPASFALYLTFASIGPTPTRASMGTSFADVLHSIVGVYLCLSPVSLYADQGKVQPLELLIHLHT